MQGVSPNIVIIVPLPYTIWVGAGTQETCLHPGVTKNLSDGYFVFFTVKISHCRLNDQNTLTYTWAIRASDTFQAKVRFVNCSFFMSTDNISAFFLIIFLPVQASMLPFQNSKIR